MAGRDRDAIHTGEEAPASAVEQAPSEPERVHGDPAVREDEPMEAAGQEDRTEQTEEPAVAEDDGTAAAEVESTGESEDDVAVESLDELRLEIQRLSQEREQLVAQYTRLRADFENFRRRKDEEFAQLRQSATADVIKQLLPVLDNLERAAASTSDHAAESQILQGINMVLRQFKQVLEQFGVEEIPSVGHPFDPNVHEAVGQVEAGEAYEPGTVVEELQRGYRMGDRILRYSMVHVAASE